MNTNSVVLVGNLVEAPEVSVTQSTGVARAWFRLAHTDRRRDPQTETWQDGDSVFLDVICWRRLAENVGNSLQKGDRVVVTGRLRQWTAERDGVRRVVTEVDAETVSPDLQRGLVTIARPRRQVSAGEEAVAGGVDAPAIVNDAVGVSGVTGVVGLPGEGGLGAGPAEVGPAEVEPDWGRPLVEAGS